MFPKPHPPPGLHVSIPRDFPRAALHPAQGMATAMGRCTWELDRDPGMDTPPDRTWAELRHLPRSGPGV